MRYGRTLVAIAGAVAAAAAFMGTAYGEDKGSNKRMVLDREAILNRWEAIASAAGASPAVWRHQYTIQLQILPDEILTRLAELDPNPANARESYRQFTQVFVNAYANAVMNPKPDAKGPAKLGSTTIDQVFIPIPPCRIVDTRNAGGPIAAGTARNFWYFSDTGTYNWALQGGVSGNASTTCPGSVLTSSGGTLGTVAPSAAMATVTVVNATAAGNWFIWGGVGNPSGSTGSALNWAAGQVLANTTVIPWGGRSGSGLGGSVQDFAVKYNGPSGQADVVVDVVGYFVENQATALQCVQTFNTGPGASDVPTNSSEVINPPACTTGYTRTAVNCSYGGANIAGFYLQEVSSSFSRCWWFNATGATLSSNLMRAESVCCRVPGQ